MINNKEMTSENVVGMLSGILADLKDEPDALIVVCEHVTEWIRGHNATPFDDSVFHQDVEEIMDEEGDGWEAELSNLINSHLYYEG